MTSKDRMRMAIASGLALQTVSNWDRGRSVTPANEKLLTDTAEELGLSKQGKEDRGLGHQG
jgi:hypothetical protein